MSYAIENTALCLDEDITCQVDFNDLENENGEETEVEETQKFIKTDVTFSFLKTDVVSINYVTSSYKNYKTQHLEFSTPPPELV